MTENNTPGSKIPVKRTRKEQAKAAKRALAKRQADELQAQHDTAKAQAAMLAQIVNLHISGHSLAEIGLAIGASAAEVDRMLTQESARYVRNQPQLRTYVRNWISERYTAMIEADYDIATDKLHPEKLDHQDRVLRILNNMAKLHGALAPVQTEVKVDAAPEAVDKMVAALAARQGLAYDISVFDTVPGTVVHEAVEQSREATRASGNAVEESDGDDDL